MFWDYCLMGILVLCFVAVVAVFACQAIRAIANPEEDK